MKSAEAEVAGAAAGLVGGVVTVVTAAVIGRAGGTFVAADALAGFSAVLRRRKPSGLALL